MTRHSKVFVPVSVDERLPEKEDRYSVIVDGVQESAYFNGKQFEFAVYMEKYITHWLEEKENVYVLTEEELNQIINEKLKSQSAGQKITLMELIIINILAKDNKEKFSTEIALAYNHITGKNYNRKNMSSLLAKMAKKKLITCRKISDSIIAKQLWSIPKTNPQTQETNE